MYVGTDSLEEVVSPSDLAVGVTASIQRSYSLAVENRRSGKRVATHRKVAKAASSRGKRAPHALAPAAGARSARAPELLLRCQPLADDMLDGARGDDEDSGGEGEAPLEPGATVRSRIRRALPGCTCAQRSHVDGILDPLRTPFAG